MGKGKEALQYLSRYLYRGVIANKNIIESDGDNVTFRYINSHTKEWETRTVKGEEFINLLMQHVLPKGFRRARDYSFLHGNARKIIQVIQWILKVDTQHVEAIKTAINRFVCPKCHATMEVVGIRYVRQKPG